MSRPIRVSFAALALLASLAGAQGAVAAPGKAFVKKAMEGDNSEVSLGKLAEQRGSSTGVRDFGHMLQMDHSMHKDKLAALAPTVGAKPTDDMPLMAKMEHQKLEGLSGPAFDREFAKDMVKDHTNDIADYEKQARGHGPTADLARDTLPTLHKHLATAQHLMRRG
jgi:putative membrane protein